MAYNFDAIARRYDGMNHLMTLGLDRCWRRKAVGQLSGSGPEFKVLDVACGTGDLALALRAAGAVVTGVDLSEPMLAVARKKCSQIDFRHADAEQLPFADASFDAVTCAFGIRNFVHLERGLAQMARVLRPGGRMVLLELSAPAGGPAKALYKLYALHLIPLMGQLLAGSREAYTYLPRSVMAFHKPHDVARMVQQAGLERCTMRSLTFGACTIYTADKPIG